MKALIIALAVFAALGLSAVLAAPSGTINFSAEPVQVGDDYTVSGSVHKSDDAEFVVVCALYSETTFCYNSDVIGGDYSADFTAVDRGADSEGGKVKFGPSPWFVIEEGEVLHIVWTPKKCGAHGCYDVSSHDTLTVNP